MQTPEGNKGSRAKNRHTGNTALALAGALLVALAGVADGHIPIVAGQHYAVMITQLVDFRGTERVDLRMNAFAARHHLADSQDIADVAAHISSMPTRQTNDAGTGEFIALGAQV